MPDPLTFYLDVVRARLAKMTRVLHPYVTGTGGVAIPNGPFPIAEACAIGEVIEHAATDLAHLERLVRMAKKVMDTVEKELNEYDESWVKEHAKDDHLVSLDHKDEISLMETLMVLRDALARWQAEG